ncbi:MAG TPA: hypothetical protein VJA23_03555 [Candidatus Nanoarchaeia archaeon]|nr:hypothetical protein [Candidatus Nanoarchaeia archaeon]
MDLIKITPDKEKAKNILQMVLLIEERIKIQDREKMAALIIVDYYEIIKELITAILLADGYKTLSHKDLVTYLEEKFSDFLAEEIYLIDQLRILRNRVAYEGFLVNSIYLKKNENQFREIINKLRRIVKDKVN